MGIGSPTFVLRFTLSHEHCHLKRKIARITAFGLTDQEWYL